ncbi:MAG: septum site-determining protein MinC [Limnobacter sp.]|nr:septum site-determining protein MinC [Limnobacter sp.]
MNSPTHLVDFKFGKTNAVVIALSPAPQEELLASLKGKLVKATAVYQNEPAVVDFSGWSTEDFENHPVQIAAILNLTRQSSMNTIEVRSQFEAHEDECEQLGIRHETPVASKPVPEHLVAAELETQKRHPEQQTEQQTEQHNEQPGDQPNDQPNDQHGEANTQAEHRIEPTLEERQVVQAPAERKTMVVEQPVRSGQRIYAQGADLIVMGQVSAGAEVIADGNVHVYGVLRGRALAGAAGDAKARILSTCFEAELVSIAGYYLTFEAGHPQDVRSQPTSIHLATDERGNTVRLKPINIR